MSSIKMKEYKCHQCGKLFKRTRLPKDKVIGCSKACRYQLRNEPIKCKVCGSMYLPKTKKTVVCSRECAGKSAQTKEAKAKRKKTVRKKYGVNNILESKEIQKKTKDAQEKKYGGVGFASKEIRKKSEQTNLKRYGAKNPFGSKEIRDKIKKINIEKYGFENPTKNKRVKEKRIKTNLERYGVENPMQTKKVLDKVRKTNLEKYGVEYTIMNKDVKEKAKNTLLKNYGVTSPFLSKEIQDKIKKTNLERYGVENPFGSKEIQDKVKATTLKRYGVDNYSKSKELQKEIKERDNYVIELYKNGVDEYEIAELLDYEYITIRRILLRNNIVSSNSISRINKYWAHKIKKTLGVEFKHEGKIFTNKRMSVDLYNRKLKLAIDINPTITHSTQETPYSNIKTTPIKCHQNRGIDALENGWELIQIFDWDRENDIIELLKSKFHMNKRIFARKCIVKEISHSDSKDFLDNNHRQEGKVNSSIQYGLFYKGELTQVMTFSKERFSRNRLKNSYELLRLTSKRGITVVGGASKLFKAFTRSHYRPQSVKTFADFSKGTGSAYYNLGMKCEGFANLNASYANIHTGKAYKVTQVTNKYMKEYKKLGLSQKEFMNKKGFYRIVDAGNKIYRWTRKESDFQ